MNTCPILVTGNQKTGSTAIAALLGKATDQSVQLDVFYGLKENAEEKILMGRLQFAQFVHHYQYLFTSDIIKEPGFIFYWPQVQSFFPDSRSICIIRDPRDNIRSILNRLNLPGNLERLDEDQLNTLPNRTWRAIVDGELFHSKGANYIESLALRWNRAASIYEQYSQRFILIRYEDFKTNKAEAIYELAAALNLTVTQDISDSVNVQYQSKGNSEVDWLEFFGPKNLSLIETTCGQKMLEYKYVKTLIS